MGVAGQLGLILKKNLILRARQPVILFLEIIWPIAIFVAVALIRQSVPPTEISTCSYNPRSMPSSGVLPFVQSFVCNINNKCQSNGKDNEIIKAGKRMMQLQRSFQPVLVEDSQVANALQSIPSILSVLDTVGETLEKDEVKQLLDLNFTIGDMFRNKTEVKDYLTQEAKVLTPEIVDILFSASINITTMLELTGNINFKTIVCTVDGLRSYVVFRSIDDIGLISRSLCNINESAIPDLVDMLQNQIDVAKIMRIVALMNDFKEDYTLGKAFRDLATLVDTLYSTSVFKDIGDKLPDFKAFDWFFKAMDVVSNLPQREKDLEKLLDMLDDLEPMITGSVGRNSSAWQQVKMGVGVVLQISQTLNKGMAQTAEGATFDWSSLLLLTKDSAAFLQPSEILSKSLQDWYKVKLSNFQTVDGSMAAVNAVIKTVLGLVAEDGMQHLPDNLRQMLDLYDTSLYFTDYINKLTRDHGKILLRMINSDEQLKKSVHSLIKAGPLTTATLIQYMSNGEVLSYLMKDPAEFLQYHCKMDLWQNLKKMDDKVNVTLVEEALCGLNVTTLMQTLNKELDINTMQMKIEWYIKVLTNASMSRHLDIETVIEKAVSVYQRMASEESTIPQDWEHLLTELKLTDKELMSDWETKKAEIDGALQMFALAVAPHVLVQQLEQISVPQEMAPLLESVYYQIKGQVTSMQMMIDVLNEKPTLMLGRMMKYIVNYGSDILNAVSKAIRDPVKISMLAQMEVADLCKADLVNKVLVLPAEVPLQEILTFMCSMDVEKLAKELNMMFGDIDSIMKTMMNDHSDPNMWLPHSNSSNPYSNSTMPQWSPSSAQSQLNWTEVVQTITRYSTLNQQVSAAVEKFMYNPKLPALSAAFDTFINSTGNFMTSMQSYAVVFNMVDMIMGNATEWKTMKIFMNMIDKYNAFYLAAQNMLMDMPSLDKMYEKESPMYDVMTSMKKMMPEMMDAMTKAMQQPQQMVTKLMTMDMSKPFCNGTSLTDLMDFKDKTSVLQFEEAVCKMTTMSEAEMMKMIPVGMRTEWNEYMESITLYSQTFVMPNTPNVNMNWTTMLMNMEKLYNDMTMMNMPNDEQLQYSVNKIMTEMGLNMTAVSQQLMQMLNSLDMTSMTADSIMKNLDLKGMDSLLDGLEKEFPQIIKEFKAQLASQYIFIKFADIQMSRLNNDTSSLKNLIKSAEFDKLIEAMQMSPDLVHILLSAMTTQAQMITDVLMTPEKAGQLCQNLTFFTMVFPKPANSAIDMAKVHASVCKAVNIDWNRLHQDMITHTPGYKEMVNDYEALITQGKLPQFSLDEFVQLYTSYMQNVERVSSLALWYSGSDLLDEKWLQEETWKQMIKLLDTGNLSEEKAILDGLKGLDSVLPLLQNMSAWYEVRLQLSAQLHALTMIRSMLRAINESSDFSFSSFFKSSEMDKILRVVPLTPDVAALVLNSMLLHPEMIIEMMQSPQTLAGLCMNQTAFRAVFVPAPGDTYSIALLHQSLCGLAGVNITLLYEQLSASVEGLKEYSNILMGMPSGPFSFVDYYTSQAEYMALLNSLMLSANKSVTLGVGDNSWMDVNVWTKVMGTFWTNFEKKLADPAYLDERSKKVMMMLTPYMSQWLQMLGQTNPELMSLIAANNAIITNLNQQLAQYIGTNVTLSSLTQGYTEVPKVVALLNNMTDLLEVLLNTVTQDPGKISHLVTILSNPAAFCSADLSQVLVVPATVAMDVLQFQARVCQLNWTAIEQELMLSFGADILSQAPSNSSMNVDFASYFMNNMKLYQTLSQLTAQPPDFSDPKLPWLDTKVWENIMTKYSQQLNNMQSSLSTSSAQLLSQLSSLLGNDSDVLINSVQALVSITKFYLEGDFMNWDYWMKTSGSEVVKLLQLVSWSPDVSAIIVNTLLSAEKSAALNVLLQTNPMAFCTTPKIGDYLVVPSGVSLDPQTLQQTLCSLNATLLMTQFEAINAKLIGPLLQLFQSGMPTPPVNMSQLVTDIANIQSSLTNLQLPAGGSTPHWMNSTVWEALSQQLVNALGTANMNLGNNPTSLFQSLATLLPLIHNNTEVNSMMNMYSAVIGVMGQKLNSLNLNSIDIASFFRNSPETSRLLAMIQDAPEILHVLLVSLSTEKMAPLWNMSFPDAMMKICDPRNDIQDYLTLPADSNIDLTSLKNQFCAINISAVMTEYQGEFNVDEIMNAQSAGPFNMSLFIDRLMAYQAFFTPLMSPGANMQLKPQRWMNASAWLFQLTKYAESQGSNPMQIANNIKQSLEMLSEDEALKPAMTMMGHISNHIAQIVANEIADMTGKNVTLMRLFKDMPKLYDYFTKFSHLLPQMVDGIINQEIKNGSLLMKMWSTGNIWLTVCNMSIAELEDVFTFPNSVNLTALQSWFCAFNEKILTDELTTRFHIAKVMDQVAAGTAVNWTQVLMNSMKLSQAFGLIMSNPPNVEVPQIDVVKILQILERNNAALDMSDPSKSASYFMEQYLRIMNSLKDTEYGEFAYQYMSGSAAKAFWDTITQITAKLSPQLEAGRLELSRLFANSKSLMQLLEKTLDSDLLAVLLKNTTIRVDVLQGMITRNFQGVICNEATLTQLLVLPPGFDVKRLASVICSVNAQNLTNELMAEFNIPNLIAAMTAPQSSSLDTKTLLQSYNAMQESVSRLLNITSVTFKEKSLEQMFANLKLHDPMTWKIVQQYAQTSPMSQIDAIKSFLELLEMSAGGSRGFYAFISATKILVASLNDKASSLHTWNLTVSTVFRDSPALAEMMRVLFARFPATVQHLTSAQLTVPQVGDLSTFAEVQKMFCDLSAGLSADARHFICNNLTDVYTELQKEVNVNAIMQEIARITNPNTTLAQFDWNSYISDFNRLIENVNRLSSTHNQIPFISDFFEYKGNFSDWVRRMEQALQENQAAMTPESLMQMVAMATADSLSPVFNSVPMLRNYYNALNIIAKYATKQVKTIPSGHMTFNKLFPRATHIKTLLHQVLNNSDHLFNAIMNGQMDFSVVIRSLTEDITILELCNMNFPKDKDGEAVKKILCETNATLLMQEIDDRFEYNALISQISSASVLDQPINVTEVVLNILAMSHLMNDKFSSALLPSIEQFFGLSGTYTDLMNKLIESVGNRTVINPEWYILSAQQLLNNLHYINDSSVKYIEQYLSVYKHMSQVLTDTLTRLKGKTLTLDELLMNATVAKQFLRDVYRLSPELSDALMNAPINVEKIGSLFSSADIGNTLCTAKVSELFRASGSHVNVTRELQRVLCSLNVTLLAEQLTQQFDINKFMALLQGEKPLGQPFNLEAPLRQFAQFQQLLDELIANPPKTDQELTDLMNISKWFPALNQLGDAYYTEIISRSVDQLEDSLNQMIGALSGSGVSALAVTLNQYLNVINKAMNTYTDALKTNGLVNASSDGDTTQFFTNLFLNTESNMVKNIVGFVNQGNWLYIAQNKDTFVEMMCNTTTLTHFMEEKLINSVHYDPKTGRSTYEYRNRFMEYQKMDVDQVSKALCGQPPEKWPQLLKAAGFKQQQIDKFGRELLRRIDLMKCDTEVYTIGGYNYTSSYCKMVNQPSPYPLRLSDSVKQIQDLIMKFGLNGFIMNGGVNYEKLMENILPYFSQTLMSIVTSGGVTEWRPFYTAGILLKFIDSHLASLSENEKLNFGLLFEDSSLIKRLLTEVMSESDAAQLLTAAISPQQYMEWISMNSSMLSSKCQQASGQGNDHHMPMPSNMTSPKMTTMAPNMTMDTPDKVYNATMGGYYGSRHHDLLSMMPKLLNEGRVKMAMCRLLSNESHAKTFFGEMGLSKLMQEVIKINDKNYSPKVDPFKFFTDQYKSVMDKLQTLLEAESTGDVTSALLKLLTDSQASLMGSGCVMINQMNPNHPFVAQMKGSLYIQHKMTSLTNWQIAHLPDIQKMVCNLNTMKVAELYESFKDMNGLWAVEQILSLVNSEMPETLNCPALSKAITKSSQLSMDTKLYEGLANYQCQLQQGDFAALNEIDWWMAMFRNLMQLTEDIPDLAVLKSLTPLINDIQRAVIKQRPNLVNLGNIMGNLRNSSLGADTDFMAFLRDAQVNAQQMVELVNSPVDRMLSVFCDPAQIRMLLHIKKATNATHGMLCDRQLVQQLRETINASQAVLKAAQNVSYYMDTSDLKAMFESIAHLMQKLPVLTQIQDMTFGRGTADLLPLLKVVQQILIDKDPQSIFDNVADIGQKFLEVIGVDSPYTDDVKKLIDGVKGMSIIVKLIPPTVRLRHVIKNEDNFERHLVNELGLSPAVARAVLDSSISITKMLNVSEETIAQQVCQVKGLQDLLIFAAKDVAMVANVSSQLCGISHTLIPNITETVLSMLDIGQMVKDMFAFDIDEILKKANVTSEDVKKIVNNFKTLENEISSVVHDLNLFTQSVEVSTQGDKVAEQLTTPEALKSMSRMMCGEQSALSVTDEFGIGDVLGSTADTESNNWSTEQEQEMKELGSPFCVDMYKMIHQTSGGAIIWTFLKPLLRGRIPFTPDTPLTRRIMGQANGTFSEVKQLKAFAETFMTSLSGLKSSGSNKGIEALKEAAKNPLVDGLIQNTLGLTVEELVKQLDLLSSMDAATAKKMQVITGLLANVTQCLVLDRFEGYANEKELEKRAQELSDKKQMLAAIVFLNVDGENSRKKRSGDPGLPKHIKYKIRMNVNSVPSTQGMHDLFPTPGSSDNFATDLGYMQGFIQLQDMIDQAIIKIQSGKDKLDIPDIEVKQFPYPCHQDDKFLSYVSRYLFPMMMTMAWLVVVGVSVKNLVHDKEIGLEQTMKIMGLRSGVNWLAWFLNTFLGMVLMSAIITIVMKFGGLAPHSDGILFFLFLVVFSLATTMMCYMISAFFTRATVASLVAVIVYLISYLPFIISASLPGYLQMEHYIIILLVQGLSATSAFGVGNNVISVLEVQLEGIQFANADRFTGEQKLSWTMYMMLFDSLLYGLIGWYVNNLKPGKYGLPQPWYFPFSPSYWGCCRGNSSNHHYSYYSNNKFTHPEEEKGVIGQSIKRLNVDEVLDQSGASRSAKGPGEMEPKDLPIGISLSKLTKKYKKKTVVDELTANVYQGQITALLGENGAGKTTTINMLTGFFPSSSGSAFINGYNVDTDASDIRRILGVCPQRDVLFDTMTVEEHLMMYGSLKSGEHKLKVKAEVESMLDSMGLYHMRHVRARDLSGGQRRRLSVGIAFIGESKVVILDEPTSGVDPAARRSIWDLILQQRAGRTILLSTHHLDEADILSDRIIIMNKGKLTCSGSPMYLKNVYGSGYTLTIDKEKATSHAQGDTYASLCKSSEVLEFICRHIPGARQIEEIGSEIKFILPRVDTKANAFYGFFTDLDAHQARLHISSYGVSDTSLEEVFLKVCASNDSKHQDLRSPSGAATAVTSGEHSIGMDIPSVTPRSLKGSHKVAGVSLTLLQMWALLCKRFHHYRRDLRLFLSLILLPCLFILLAMLCTMIKPSATDPNSLLMTPANVLHEKDMFLQSKYFTAANQKLTNAFVDPPGLGTTCMQGMNGQCSTSYTIPNITLPKSCSGKYRYPMICNCTAGKTQCSATEGRKATSYQLRTNNKLADLNCYNVEDYLLHEYEAGTFTDRYGGWSLGGATTTSNGEPNTIWFNNNFLTHGLPALVNSLSNALLRAHVPADASEYGISVYSHPMKLNEDELSETAIMQRVADTGIALTIVCAFCFVPAGFIIYLVTENINKEKRLQLIHGVGPILYWITTLVWDMMMCALTVGITIAIMAAFQLPSFTARLNLPAVLALLLLFCWSNVSLVYLFVTCFGDPPSAYLIVFVVNFMTGILTTLVTFLLNIFGYSATLKTAHYWLSHIFLIFPQFNLGNGLIKILKNQMLTELFANFGEDVYRNPFSYDMVAWNLIAMAATGTFFFILLLVISAVNCSRTRRNTKSSPDHREDDDVSLERQRVVTGDTKADLLVLKNLTKVYTRGFKKVLAVNNVCVGVKKGECFGLLGVNGAGKTTTFNMVTCETDPTIGSVQLENQLLCGSVSAMEQNIGYCPQFDALDLYMTSEEVLFCYGRLKGIPGDELPMIVDSALRMLGIQSYAKKMVKNLSGGTKRKLSVALALLADPQLLLLDEPTTGMDAASKRYMWNVLIQVLKENRSVILTSHSMEECDSLCTRLAIMVNGHFSCLGSPQHIKHKFGDGYTLKLRISGGPSDVSNAMLSIRDTFPRAQLKDEHLNMLELQIPTVDAHLADIFGFIEQQKFKLSIDDYSVSQTSLDQVFVRFAKLQSDGITELSGDDSSQGSSSGSSRSKSTAYVNRAYESWSPSARSSDENIPRAKTNIYDNLPRREDEIRRSLKSLEKKLESDNVTSDIGSEAIGPHAVKLEV